MSPAIEISSWRKLRRRYDTSIRKFIPICHEMSRTKRQRINNELSPHYCFKVSRIGDRPTRLREERKMDEAEILAEQDKEREKRRARNIRA